MRVGGWGRALSLVLALAVGISLAGCSQEPAPRSWTLVARDVLGRTTGPVALGGRWAFVPNMADGTVSQIDRANGRVIATIRVSDPRLLLAQGCNPGSEHAYYYGSWGWRACDSPFAVAWDGSSLWALDNGLRQLVRVDPIAHRAADRIPLPGTGWAIAIDSSTAWISGYADHSLYRVDLPTRALLDVVDSLDPEPASVTTAAGAVWVISASGDTQTGHLDRVDTTTGAVTRRDPIGRWSDDVVADQDGILIRTGGSVSRVNEASGAIEWTRPGPGFLGRPGIDEIGVTPKGIWLSGSTTERIDPSTGLVVESIHVPSAAVAAGGDELWLLGLDGAVSEYRWT